jgi:hypothetical protein
MQGFYQPRRRPLDPEKGSRDLYVRVQRFHELGITPIERAKLKPTRSQRHRWFHSLSVERLGAERPARRPSHSARPFMPVRSSGLLGGSSGEVRKAAISKHAWGHEIRELRIDGVKQFMGDASDRKTSSPLERFILLRRNRPLGHIQRLRELGEGRFQ